MAWDPKAQDCHSYFGYGSGFFMREEQARAKQSGYAPDQSQALLKAGRPDPWTKDFLENIRRGNEASDGLAA